jgi:cytochrome c553
MFRDSGVRHLAILLLPGIASVALAQVQSTNEEFFENRIRPVLAENCFACHTNSRLGGLRLDSRDALLAGGKSGPAVIAGDSSGSLLMQAVRQTHSRLKMPPQSRLEAREIADLAAWIDGGAAWPAKQEAIASQVRITPEQRAFWSFQPVRRTPISHPSNTAWAKNDIDRFLLARMEAEKVTPAKAADKRTLIRRVTFDLIGLPPTPKEIAEFLADDSPSAFEKVVDRLLNSPHYGERWARYWLDLARYSDGKQAARDDSPLPNAYRYRDWVIAAFNSDMPFDVFVKAQIAADHMPLEGRENLLPGLGFQALGENNSDRVDVTTRVFLGLTVGCAQCHDHKFDPIPTRDYYSLLGVFESSRDEEYPLAPLEVVEAYKSGKQASERKQAELKQFLDKQVLQVTEILASQSEQYVMAAWQLIVDPTKKTVDVAAPERLDVETLERWVKYLQKNEREHGFFAAWDELGKRGSASEKEARIVAKGIASAIQDVLREKSAIEDRNYVKLGGQEGMKDTDKVISTLVDALPIEKYYFWRDMASRPYKVEDLNFGGGIYYYGPKDVERFLGEHWQRYLTALRAEVKQLEAAIPPPYPFWHVLKDSDKPRNSKVAIRGDASNPGEEAPRQFLSVLTEGKPKQFSQGSGRMELANAIASPDNPLTARVMVNRIWKHHFGEGIVRSTGNFGQLGDRPSHPELLDYLALRFIESGWSVKTMHREMILSAAYQMSSAEDVAGKDPENRLFSRAPVRERLDAEALRDSILAASGTLDRTIGGPAKPLRDDHLRRTIYATVSRSKPDRTMAMFDFPDPNATAEQRIVTVGPMQRLFFMNSSFVALQSKALADRLCKQASDDRDRIGLAYEILFGRPATNKEIEVGMEFLTQTQKAWPQYAQVLFGTTEFTAVQ